GDAATLWAHFEDEPSSPQTALEMANAWNTEDGDICWLVRKGMLLAELEKGDQSYECLCDALFTVRRAIKVEGETPKLLSYEQWIEMYATDLQWRRDVRKKDKDNPIEPRTPELNHRPEHPTRILAHFARELDIISNLRTKEKPLDFDFGIIRESVKYQCGYWPGLKDVRQFENLVRQAALVPRLGVMRSGGSYHVQERLQCAEYYVRKFKGHCSYSLSLMLRAHTSGQFKTGDTGHILASRFVLALTTRERIDYLVDKILPRTQYNFDQPNSNSQQLEYGLEFLGRLAGRLNLERRQELLKEAISWYTNVKVTNTTFWLHRPYADFLCWTIQSLPKAMLANFALDLFQLPVLPLSPCSKELIEWMYKCNWANAIPNDFPSIACKNVQKDSAWRTVSDKLIDELMSTKCFVKESLIDDQQNDIVNSLFSRFWIRLVWLKTNRLLNEMQLNRLWEYLSEILKRSYPPINLGLPLWAILTFVPDNSDATWEEYKDFVFRVADTQFNTEAEMAEFLAQAFCFNQELAEKYTLTETEKGRLLDLLQRIALPQKHVEQTLFVRQQRDKTIYNIVRVLLFAIGFSLKKQLSLRTWLPTWLQEVNKSNEMTQGTSAYHIKALLLLVDDSATTDFLKEVELTLAMDSDQNAINAGSALLLLRYVLQPDNDCIRSCTNLLVNTLWRSPPLRSLNIISLLSEEVETYDVTYDNENLSLIQEVLVRLNAAFSYDVALPKSKPGIVEPDAPFPLELPEQRWNIAKFVNLLCRKHPSAKNLEGVKMWICAMAEDPWADMQNIYYDLVHDKIIDPLPLGQTH
ncbi:MAG: hypothetical protein LBS23_01255, partial [Holosporaceae bacterium]|nr:hypothetical protein [Holosporaceae bacterium]